MEAELMQKSKARKLLKSNTVFSVNLRILHFFPDFIILYLLFCLLTSNSTIRDQDEFIRCCLVSRLHIIDFWVYRNGLSSIKNLKKQKKISTLCIQMNELQCSRILFTMSYGHSTVDKMRRRVDPQGDKTKNMFFFTLIHGYFLWKNCFGFFFVCRCQNQAMRLSPTYSY